MLTCLVGCGQAADHPAAAGPTAEGATWIAPALEPGGDPPACMGASVEAEPLPVDVLALLDGSSSMREATISGVSKWSATRAAFRDFLAQAPRGMGLGLSLFPVPGDESASCRTERYRDMALPIGDVGEMMNGVLAKLDAVEPYGQTPTAPAFTAALATATAHALEHRERSVIVVLATDGLPTTCDPVDTAALAKLASDALRGPGHVRTLVVASRSLASTEQRSFDALAGAGGTGQALIIDPHVDFSAQLRHALGAAATRRVACDLALPEPPDQQRLDYDAVNVVLETSSARVTFPRVEGAESCSSAGGWYYDVDPAHGAPSRLNMCEASCERLGNTGTARLRVEVGCATVVR